MIIIHTFRITDGNKCFAPVPVKSKFCKQETELEAFAETKLQEYIKRKYPKGFPITRDLEKKPILCETTNTTVPDREFLFYLVSELNYKVIPKSIIRMFEKKEEL